VCVCVCECVQTYRAIEQIYTMTIYTVAKIILTRARNSSIMFHPKTNST
jgi:hypothetical protein